MIEIKTPSEAEFYSIIFDNEIYDRISDDHSPAKEDFRINLDDYKIFGFFLGKKIIGILTQDNKDYIHLQVLKSYRKDYASIGLRTCLDKLKGDIFCEIPTLYKNVIDFAEMHGFKKWHIEKDSYLKNRLLYDKIKFKLIK